MRYITMQGCLSNRNTRGAGCIIKYRIKEGVRVGETPGIPSTKSLKMRTQSVHICRRANSCSQRRAS